MKTEIFENYEAFLGRTDKTINGVTKEFLTANPNEMDERGNKGCWNCSDCFNCSGLFEAMQIYKASSSIRVSPVRFYETNAVALADMKRCAHEEKAL